MKHALGLFLISLLAAGATAFAGAVSDGNSLYRAGRYDDAILRYGDAQGKDLDPAVVHFNVGDAQYRKKKFDEAGAAFERALGTRDPLLEAKAQYNIGNCRYRQGRLPDALESYKKAIELLSGDEDTGAEGKKVRADAQANYEFVQNKIKEEAKPSQQQPQDKDKNKDKQKQQQPQGGGQGKDKQPQSGKDQQKEQAGQDQKEKEQQAQQQEQQQKDSDKKEKEKQAQAAAQKEKKDEQKQQQEKAQAQAQKDKKDQGKGEKQNQAQAQPQPVQMSKEEAANLLEGFGQFEDRKKIQDKFNADEPRPAKDW